MKRKHIFLIFYTLLGLNSFSQIVHGHYITNSNDTVNAQFYITDLVHSQYELTIVDSTGGRSTLNPSDIKGFWFVKSSFTCWSVDPFYRNIVEKDIESIGFKFKPPLFSSDPEIHHKANSLDSIWKYQSCNVSDDLKAFVLVKYGYGEFFQAGTFYSNTEPFPIWVLIKDNKLVHRHNMSTLDWLSNSIVDYPQLSSMVKNKKFCSFPYDLDIIIGEYNSHYKSKDLEKSDTSMTIKGINDADKYYHPVAPFIITSVGSLAFYLPGLTAGVIMAHTPSESNTLIPKEFKDRENQDYSRAFKHKIYTKKHKSIGNGFVTGLSLLLIGLIIVCSI
jgi:hypothetical protein